MRLNRKGISTDAPQFTTNQLAILILFVILLAIMLILIIPKVGSGEFSDAASNFGKSIYNILTGGGD